MLTNWINCRHCFGGHTLLVWTRFKDGWYAVRNCLNCKAEELDTPEAAAISGALGGRDFYE